jgi:hypothetical protein
MPTEVSTSRKVEVVRPRRRFQAWELPSGWTVLDLDLEAIALPVAPMDAEAAASVADALCANPAHTADWTWSPVGAGRAEEVAA